MARYRLQKIPERLSDPRQSVNASGRSIVRGLRYGLRKILEEKYGGSKMHG
jgi:hypothetical protein